MLLIISSSFPCCRSGWRGSAGSGVVSVNSDLNPGDSVRKPDEPESAHQLPVLPIAVLKEAELETDVITLSG
jgi:hypothetical protein